LFFLLGAFKFVGGKRGGSEFSVAGSAPFDQDLDPHELMLQWQLPDFAVSLQPSSLWPEFAQNAFWLLVSDGDPHEPSFSPHPRDVAMSPPSKR